MDIDKQIKLYEEEAKLEQQVRTQYLKNRGDTDRKQRERQEQA